MARRYSASAKTAAICLSLMMGQRLASPAAAGKEPLSGNADQADAPPGAGQSSTRALSSGRREPGGAMNFEPQKFFIGLMDFFSILLPGALLSWVLKDSTAFLALRGAGPVSESQSWLMFFFSSYLLGHFIFLLGSWLDEAYGEARRLTYSYRLKELAKRGTLLSKLPRFFLWLVFKRENDWAVDQVKKIKHHYLNPLQARDAVNTFQWAKLQLALEKPEVLATVQRFEADSKFFRSLVVVLFLMAFAMESGRIPHFWAFWVVLLCLALWRYMEQRHKASCQAYWAVLALEGRAGKIQFPKPAQAHDAPTHAGGVVFREKRRRGVEYLVVESTGDPDEWVLPKGHIETGEDPRLTAVREVREETGAFAKIEKSLRISAYELNEEVIRVQFYLMRALEQWRPIDPSRRRKWLTLEQAKETVRAQENKLLLDEGETLRKKRLAENA
jgi:8-oxo-dGTP pyrophosphatase MutT (NUDIX family)